MPDVDTTRQSDHDSIVTLVSEVKNARVEITEIKRDIKEVKNDIVSRVAMLESEKVGFKEFNRLDTKVSWLIGIAYTGIGFCFAAEFYFAFLRPK